MGVQEEHSMQNREPRSRPAAVGVCHLWTDLLRRCVAAQIHEPTLGRRMVCYGIEVDLTYIA